MKKSLLVISLLVSTSPVFAAIPANNNVKDFKNIVNELYSNRKAKTQKYRSQRGLTIKAPHKRVKKPKSVSKKTSRLIKVKRPTLQPRRTRPLFSRVNQTPTFDLPITYNKKVKKWIHHFQTSGAKWFHKRLERSHRYLPKLTAILKQKGLPQDLAYIAMIESGFSSRAVSSAQAVGYWQFIKPTANRYGLRTNWWLDERRDYTKSTVAAAAYLSDLYKMFGSWYLSAAGYNMGEGRVRRLIRRHKTRNFWTLSQKKDFPDETRNYIPKLIAAMIIAKTPHLYGFRNIKPWKPYKYTYIHAPGGTDLHNMAAFLGVSPKELTKMNPELKKGFIPKFIKNHRIRIPSKHYVKATNFLRKKIY